MATITGTTGNDPRNDTLGTGDYYDMLGGHDTVFAGAGNDTVFGGSGDDRVDGGSGNDALYGGSGLDSLVGGSGNDTLFGGSDAGAGADTLIGGDGFDYVSYANTTGQVIVNLATGVASGGDGDDRISQVEGVIGGSGADIITGDAGANNLRGLGGNDTIDGGLGNDTIEGGLGNDSMVGGGGSDTLSFDNAGAGVTVNMVSGTATGTQTGTDTFSQFEGVMGSAFADNITGDSANNTIEGGLGNDTIDGGAGNDLLIGGPEAGQPTSTTPVNLDFNWSQIGADNTTIQQNYVQDTGGIEVRVSYTPGFNGSTVSVETGAQAPGEVVFGTNYVAPGETFSANSSAELFRPGGQNGLASPLTALELDFAAVAGSGYLDEVRNVSFRIADVDEETFRDIVTVRAYDAEGNEVPVIITTTSSSININNNVATVNNFSGNLATNSPDASILVNVAGPVATLVIEYGNEESGQQAIFISDVQFQAIPAIDNDVITGGTGVDTILGGSGNDIIDGGADADSVFGGTGNDRIDAGTGDDFVDGGEGADDIVGKEGNDTLLGGAGDDTIDGGENADLIFGGAGQDVIAGGLGDDTVDGGEDADVITTDGGADSVLGGGGNDTIHAGDDNDTIFGGAGDDSLSGDAGDDSISGDEGADRITGQDGNDILFGGDDNDSVFGGNDDDQLFGGSGRDELFGGDGNDRFQGGTGVDSLYGGDGNDIFTYTLADFDGALTPEIVDGGGLLPSPANDFDTIDLTQFGWSRVDIVYTNNDPATESGTILIFAADGITQIGQINFTEIEQIIPCFTPGTMILTDRGQVPVEALRVGDLVMTRDNGLQPLRWVGQRRLSMAQLMADPDLQPVCIGRGALSGQGPDRDMLVSPQHRFLVEGARAEMLFGEAEVLVPAKHFLGKPGVQRVLPEAGVTYVHILFDRHEIVQSDGLWTESFQPADRMLSAMEAEVRAEVLALFPELEQSDRAFEGARLSLKAHEAKVLFAAE